MPRGNGAVAPGGLPDVVAGRRARPLVADAQSTWPRCRRSRSPPPVVVVVVRIAGSAPQGTGVHYYVRARASSVVSGKVAPFSITFHPRFRCGNLGRVLQRRPTTGDGERMERHATSGAVELYLSVTLGEVRGACKICHKQWS